MKPKSIEIRFVTAAKNGDREPKGPTTVSLPWMPGTNPTCSESTPPRAARTPQGAVVPGCFPVANSALYRTSPLRQGRAESLADIQRITAHVVFGPKADTRTGLRYMRTESPQTFFGYRKFASGDSAPKTANKGAVSRNFST
jgi:hypothetical protein